MHTVGWLKKVSRVEDCCVSLCNLYHSNNVDGKRVLESVISTVQCSNIVQKTNDSSYKWLVCGIRSNNYSGRELV